MNQKKITDCKMAKIQFLVLEIDQTTPMNYMDEPADFQTELERFDTYEEAEKFCLSFDVKRFDGEPDEFEIFIRKVFVRK